MQYTKCSTEAGILDAVLTVWMYYNCCPSHATPPPNTIRITHQYTNMMQADGVSSKRSVAEMEDELKIMKGDNEKWKNMCKAMEAKIIANNGGEECEEEEEEVEEEEVEEDEEEEEEEEEVEEEIVVVDKKGKKSPPAPVTAPTTTAFKSSSSASSSVSAPADQKSKGSSKGDVKGKEQEKDKEKEKKVPVMKDRKKPKDIKENPPSRGKNLTSKDKASSKKTKQKGKK